MADGESAEAPLAPDTVQKRNQIEAFRRTFGRDPVSDSEWATAAALDPHSYNPKNNGVEANIVVARIKPVPGQGVVRTNLFIPSKDVWAPVGWTSRPTTTTSETTADSLRRRDLKIPA